MKVTLWGRTYHGTIQIFLALFRNFRGMGGMTATMIYIGNYVSVYYIDYL